MPKICDQGDLNSYPYPTKNVHLEDVPAAQVTATFAIARAIEKVAVALEKLNKTLTENQEQVKNATDA